VVTKYSVVVERAMRYTFANLNERQRRLYAATEAIKLGHGGIVYLSWVLGCHRRTIERGLDDLAHSDRPLLPDQARKKGVDASAA
jgi:hypothetical protein